DDFIAGFDEIDGEAFHAGHAGAAYGERERVLRAKDLTECLASLVHDGEVLGIEMAEGRRAERAEDALGDGAGAGSEEGAFGGEVDVRCAHEFESYQGYCNRRRRGRTMLFRSCRGARGRLVWRMRVLIVGCGYVGVPLGAALVKLGHEVYGVR